MHEMPVHYHSYIRSGFADFVLVFLIVRIMVGQYLTRFSDMKDPATAKDVRATLGKISLLLVFGLVLEALVFFGQYQIPYLS